MKTIPTLLCLLITILTAQAQGTVQFLNSALSKIKYQGSPAGPVVDCPTGFKVGLFWGTDATIGGRGNGTLVNPTATIGSTPGIWNSGAVYPIPGTEQGQKVWVKIAAWDGASGDDFRLANSYGESTVVNVTLGPTAGPGTVIWQGSSGVATDRMKPFIIVVPEPTTTALGLLGVTALLLRRRTRAAAK